MGEHKAIASGDVSRELPATPVGSYDIHTTLCEGVSYLARSPAGRWSLLVPITGGHGCARSFGQVLLHGHDNVKFTVADREFQSPCAALECRDESLLPTFQALARSVSAVLAAAGRRDWLGVVRALEPWQILFRSVAQLGPDAELGLWAEILLINTATDADAALGAWKGPYGAAVDFSGGGVGIECKASFRRHEHFVSQEQVGRPLGDTPVFVASLWVGQDASAGRSLPELVDLTAGMVELRDDFEQEVLRAGYSRSHAPLYTRRFRLLERPLLFPAKAIPKVREYDTGVSQIRYMATLKPESALSPGEADAVLIRCGGLGLRTGTFDVATP